MATSLTHAMNTTRGMPFMPTNGVAAVERQQEIEAAIRRARDDARREDRKFKRTRKTKGAWGK